jgi:hypothetical protein
MRTRAPSLRAMRLEARLTLSAIVLGSWVGCQRGHCESVPLQLPAEPRTWNWSSERSPLPTVDLSVNSSGVLPALLDTGFTQSAVDPRQLPTGAHSPFLFERDDWRVGPASPQALLGPTGVSAVLGADVLNRMPFGMDARARTLTVHPSFSPAQPEALALTPAKGSGCQGPLYTVKATLEGRALELILDTGSTVLMLRTSLATSLSSRPLLEGVRLVTGFAGVLGSSVRRASLTVGAQTSKALPWHSATAVDDELDRVAADTGVQADGYLGWPFLREYDVGLEHAMGTDRFLRLARFDTQTHWTREFVGVGVNLTDVSNGLRVEGFLSTSPAQQAGVLVGDVITHIQGQPASQVAAPWGAAGTDVSLTLERGGTPQTVTVRVTDLLPDS